MLTSNIEVAQGGGRDVSAKTVLSYAVLAYSLPPGHVFQSRIEGLEGFSDLTTSSENISAAVRQWANPDVESPKKATAVALGEKVKAKAPPPKETTVTVLNGNGVTGSASNASYLLGQRGYPILMPPNGIPANAPSFTYFRTTVYFDPKQKGAKEAARKVADLFGSADVAEGDAGDPRARERRDADRGRRADVPRHARRRLRSTRRRSASRPNVVPGAEASLDLLRERQPQVDFPLMVPTVLERSSWIDRERPVRLYRFDEKGKHKTVRLTYKMGSNDYWGVQEIELGGRARAREPQLRPQHRRPPLRAVLQRPAPPHGRPQAGRARATGSSTPCSTGSRTRRCSPSPRGCGRSPRCATP